MKLLSVGLLVSSVALGCVNGAIEMAQLIVGEIRSKGGALATLLK